MSAPQAAPTSVPAWQIRTAWPDEADVAARVAADAIAAAAATPATNGDGGLQLRVPAVVRREGPLMMRAAFYWATAYSNERSRLRMPAEAAATDDAPPRHDGAEP